MEKLYDESWAPVIKPLFRQEYMKRLSAFVQEERRRYEVYPPQELVFNAFRLTPFSEVKVVILGQDPYHNVGQAHGLSFSVPEGIAFPPSLKNIFAVAVYGYRRISNTFFRGSYQMGEAGGIAAQCYAYRAGTSGGITSKARVGTLYG